MSEFVASNGVIVREHPGAIGVRRSVEDLAPVPVPGFTRPERVQTYLDPRQWEAIAEVVRAEEDARLGVWRSQDDPTWTARREGDVVYFINSDHKRAFHIALVNEAWKHQWSYDLRAIAGEYISAHPEPKLAWHDAKPGEVWLITSAGGSYMDEPAVFDGETFVFRSLFVGGGVDRATPDAVKDARRIYPEVAS